MTAAQEYNVNLFVLVNLTLIYHNERARSVTLFAYCANNPINRIDPDGRSTWVMNNSDGTYQVVGGDLNDKDLSIYIYRMLIL
jgi:hypothetical protein